MDYVEYGGVLLFGVDGVCVISYGSFCSGFIFNVICLVKEAIDN